MLAEVQYEESIHVTKHGAIGLVGATGNQNSDTQKRPDGKSLSRQVRTRY